MTIMMIDMYDIIYSFKLMWVDFRWEIFTSMPKAHLKYLFSSAEEASLEN